MNLIQKMKVKSLAAVGTLGLLMASGSLYSCVDEISVGDAFLEKQPGVEVTVDTIFAKGENAKRFLWHMYGALHNVYTYTGAVWYVPSDALTDICHSYCGWHQAGCYYGGSMSEADQDGGYAKFPFISNAGGERIGIWQTVREGWTFVENIDDVPDLSENEKSQLAGEAYVIMASRFLDAFRNFGGLPRVDRAYNAADIVDGRRMTVMQTAEFIDSIIQCAIDEPGLPFYVQDQATNSGRLTKGSAYGLRVKLWNFVASPLFNNAEPYMRHTRGEENENIEQVWLGGYKPEVWTRALNACKEFFTANAANGNYFKLVQATGTTQDDYAEAFRAAYVYRGNSEKLIEVHAGVGNDAWNGDFIVIGMNEFGMMNPTLEFFEMFPMADGSNYPYKDIYDGPNPDNIDIFANRDPRLYETITVSQPTLREQYRGANSIQLWQQGNIDMMWITAPTENPFSSRLPVYKYIRDNLAWGPYNMYYPSNFAYLRMADIHMCYAEALAHTGNLQGACDELNKVRARVGLGKIEVMNPELNLTSNLDNFIDEVLRERACEFAFEDHRWYDLVRYKRSDLFKKRPHQIRIWRKAADGSKMGEDGSDASLQPGEPWPAMMYEKVDITNNQKVWWDTPESPSKWTDKWYLTPISRDEINKGYGLNQNPGW